MYIIMMYGDLTIQNCKFSGSSAPDGDSIYVTGSTVGLIAPKYLSELVKDN